MYKKNKAFTLIEVITALVILAIIVLISVPIINTIKSKTKLNSYKRSVDNYGHAIELALSDYLIDKGSYPTSLDNLKINYSGNVVNCNVKKIKEDGTVYLSECIVNGKEIKDKTTEDGWYHYHERDLTNEDYNNYIVLYGKTLEKALKQYYFKNNKYPEDYRILAIDYKGPKIDADISINYDGTVYMNNCKVGGKTIDITYGIDKSIAINHILEKSNPISVTSYNEGDTKEMYTFEHPATEQTGALTDYRYIGATPNNYVTFNNELWRIIGVFTVEDGNGNIEQRIKIVRNEKLPNAMQWDANWSNEWTNATLNTYLNGDYYNGLDASSKNMIADTKYYLGGNGGPNGIAEKYYNWERGTKVYNKDGAIRNTSWIGKIALMYPSDYTYTYALGVDNTCYNDGFRCESYYGGVPTNGWIHNTNSNSSQWLLSPSSSTPDDVFYITLSGGVFDNSVDGVTYSYGVRPILYLKSTVKITSGTGKSDDSYKLSL